jgi:hypothetical protein
MKRIESDADIVARLRRNARVSRAIDVLAWEIRQGDATTRREAEEGLRNQGLLVREIAAIKRHLKT